MLDDWLTNRIAFSTVWDLFGWIICLVLENEKLILIVIDNHYVTCTDIKCIVRINYCCYLPLLEKVTRDRYYMISVLRELVSVDIQ